MAFASAVAITPTPLTPLTAINVATLPVSPDATHGNKFVANKYTILRVKNASGSQITVTVVMNRTVDGQTVPSDTFTVALTTGDVMYTGFTANNWMNESNEVHVTFSAVTSVTVAVYQPE